MSASSNLWESMTTAVKVEKKTVPGLVLNSCRLQFVDIFLTLILYDVIFYYNLFIIIKLGFIIIFTS